MYLFDSLEKIDDSIRFSHSFERIQIYLLFVIHYFNFVLIKLY